MIIQVKKSSTFAFYLHGRQVRGTGTIKGQVDLSFNGRQVKNAYCEWFEDTLDVSFKEEVYETEVGQAYHEAFLILEGLDSEVSLAY